MSNVEKRYYKSGDIVNGSKVIDLIIKVPNGKKYFRHGYILRCLETQELYESTHHNIIAGRKSPFLTGKKVYKGNWLYGEKHLLPFFKNPEEAKKYTKRSNKKIDCVCPSCNKEKSVKINDLYRSGFFCSYCSTSQSYSEKVISSLLELNNIKHTPEMRFEDNSYKFDFYLPEINAIIEAHGKQHYEPLTGIFQDKLAEIQENDFLKKQFSESKKITYIEIDCRESNLEFILNKINSHQLLREIFLNQDLDALNQLITEKSNYGDIKELIESRDGGLTYKEIGLIYNYKADTVRQIIKRYSIA